MDIFLLIQLYCVVSNTDLLFCLLLEPVDQGETGGTQAMGRVCQQPGPSTFPWGHIIPSQPNTVATPPAHDMQELR